MMIFLPFPVVRNKPVKPGNEISWVLVYLSLYPSLSLYLFSLSHLSSSLPFTTISSLLLPVCYNYITNQGIEIIDWFAHLLSSQLFKVKLHPKTPPLFLSPSSSPSSSLHPLGFFRNLVQFSFFTILIPCYHFPWSGTRLLPIWNFNFFKRKIFSQLDYKYLIFQVKKISSQENFTSRKFHLKKISSQQVSK